MALCVVIPILPQPALADAPENSAVSAILVDAETGRVLYEKNADEKRMIASITKLMTALVAVESTPNLTELVTIKPEWTNTEGTSVYLTAGEQLSLETLLYGLLLESGNDAALAVAGFCGGDEKTFVGWMNQRAISLGMKNTHFTNPNGLNDEGHYSTASDMSKLAIACMENDTIAKIVSTKSITMGIRTFTNHNKLLWQYDGCIGMKTGYTQLAGRTLISCAERNGQRLIAVTLSDRDDWKDHTALLDFGFETYPRFVLCTADRDFRRVPVSGSLVRFVTVKTMDELAYPLSLTEQVRAKISLPELVEAPVEKGSIAGKLTFYLNDQPVGETYLIYGSSVASNVIASNSIVRKMLDFFRHKDQETFLDVLNTFS